MTILKAVRLNENAFEVDKQTDQAPITKDIEIQTDKKDMIVTVDKTDAVSTITVQPQEVDPVSGKKENLGAPIVIGAPAGKTRATFTDFGFRVNFNIIIANANGAYTISAVVK